jgi:hypothetical protein
MRIGNARPTHRHNRWCHTGDLRRHYAEGIPRRPIADESNDAKTLYRALADIGGADLSVRPKSSMPHVLSADPGE